MVGNGWGPPIINFSTLGQLGDTFGNAYEKGKKNADERKQTLAMLGALDTSLAGGSGSSGSTNSTAGYGAGSDADVYPGTASLVGSESGGNWGARNNAVGAGGARGHFGRVQFGVARLNEAKQAGAIPASMTPQQFMASPQAQVSAERWHFGDIDNFIKQNSYDQLVGRHVINGVPVTVEGMRAVAHLGGKQGLIRFMTSGGQYNPRDANGTSLMDYFSRHGGGGRGGATVSGDPGNDYMPGSDADLVPSPAGPAAGPPPAGMAGDQFNAIYGNNAPQTPSFMQAGLSQPWMGTALRPPAAAAAPQAAMTPLPPRRPSDLANVPAPGASPAIGRMAPPMAPAMPIDPNSPDGGARAFLAAQGGFAPQQMAPAAQQPDATISGGPGTATGAGQGAGAPPAAVPQVASRQNVNAQMIRSLIAAGGQARQMGLQLWQQAVTGKNFGFQVVGDQLYRTDPRTGQVEAIPGVTKPPAPVTVGEGQTLVDPRTGQVVFQGQPKRGEAAAYEERRAQAERAGLKPGDPGYQSFILTGKMPREDQAPLTATDKKAILEADEGVLAGETAIRALNEAKQLSPRALSGAFVGLRATAGNNMKDGFLPDWIASPDAADATTQLENVVTSQALANLKAIFGAAPTEGERKILMEIQGSTSQPDHVRKQIYDRGIAMAEARLKFNRQRAAELRGGSYYKRGAPAAPAAGTVQDGYRFKGGDPASRDSWEKVD